MYTGQDSSLKSGNIHSWNYQEQTNYAGQCGKIHGSAGGFFPPKYLEHNPEKLELFAHDLCRTLTYYNTKTVSKHHSLNGINFILPISTFANSSINPDNWCYENNLPTGLQNASHCKAKNSPFLYSFPHFYGADQFYLDQFDSGSELEPSPESHISSMLIEPTTTVPIQILLRLQINLQIPR